MTGCELVRPLAAELALGTLAGSDRAAALAHLEGCPNCRLEVDSLSRTADALLLVGREVDPEVGFEVRLLERMRHEDSRGTAAGRDTVTPLSQSRKHRGRVSRRALALAAAVVLLAGTAGVLGAVLGSSGQAPRSPGVSAAMGVRTAPLVAALPGGTSRRIGEVVVAAGQPAWVLMDVTGLNGPSWVSCIVNTGSRSMSIGSFELHGGAGSWAAPVQVTGRSVQSARILAPDGTLLAVATF